jgi:hypothetical protein
MNSVANILILRLFKSWSFLRELDSVNSCQGWLLHFCPRNGNPRTDLVKSLNTLRDRKMPAELCLQVWTKTSIACSGSSLSLSFTFATRGTRTTAEPRCEQNKQAADVRKSCLWGRIATWSSALHLCLRQSLKVWWRLSVSVTPFRVTWKRIPEGKQSGKLISSLWEARWTCFTICETTGRGYEGQ